MAHPRSLISANSTPTTASIEVSSEGLRTPPLVSDSSTDSVRTRRTTLLRSSVFDVFAQLGGLEENSQLAEWMFSEEGEACDSARSSTSSATSASNTLVCSPDGIYREKSGSRFRERLGSDAPDLVLILEDDNTGLRVAEKRRIPRPSPTKRHTDIKFAPPRAPHNTRETQDRHRKSFFLFRTKSTRVSRIPEAFDFLEDDKVPPLPRISRLPLLRANTEPPPRIPDDSTQVSPISRPSFSSDTDWEKLDPLSTVDLQTLASAPNPFLGSQSHDHSTSATHDSHDNNARIPFPTGMASTESDGSSFLRRLSGVVRRSFRASSHHTASDGEPYSNPPSSFTTLRRTQSNASPTTTASRPFLFSESGPRLVPLTTSISHT